MANIMIEAHIKHLPQSRQVAPPKDFLLVVEVRKGVYYYFQILLGFKLVRVASTGKKMYKKKKVEEFVGGCDDFSGNFALLEFCNFIRLATVFVRHDDRGLLTRLKRAAQWSFGLPAAVAAAAVASVASAAVAAATTFAAAAAATVGCVSRVAALYIAPYTQRLGAGDSSLRNPESQRPNNANRFRFRCRFGSENPMALFSEPKPKNQKTDCSRQRRPRRRSRRRRWRQREMLSPCRSFRAE